MTIPVTLPTGGSFGNSALAHQIAQAFRQNRVQRPPPPIEMPALFITSAEILGQYPGSRQRAPGPLGASVIAAWNHDARLDANLRYIIHSGDGQIGPAGAMAPLIPELRVTDGFGRPPVPRVKIRFTPDQNGRVAVTECLTDGNGITSPGEWTLGTVGPNILSLERALGGNWFPLDVEFHALAVADRFYIILRGNNQLGNAGGELQEHPTLRVLDRVGQPVRDVPVIFAADKGGDVAHTNVDTNEDGTASAGRWKLGTAGDNSVQARVGGVTVATFRAKAQ
jgi:hypothetical protein